GVLVILVPGHRRNSESEVSDDGLGRFWLHVDQPICFRRQLANLLVSQPFEAMQVPPRPLIQHLLIEPAISGAITVPQDYATPVLARVARLHLPVHLERASIQVSMLDYAHRLVWQGVLHEQVGITHEDDVAVDAQAPTRMRQEGNPKPRDGELRALRRAR